MPEQLLSGSLEDNVLTLLVWHDVHASTIALRVDVSLYSTRAYVKIAELATDHLSRFGTPPRAHLRDLLEADLRRGDEGRFLDQILTAMDNLQAEIQPDYVLEQLDRFIQIRRLSQSVEVAADALHAGDLAAAEEAIASTSLHHKVEYPRAWLADTDNWLSFLDEDEEQQFSSGVGELDSRGVTPRRRSLFLTIGSSGTGKSWWLTEIGKANLVLNRKNVLHVTLEMDIDEVKLRYTQSFLSLTSQAVGQVRVPVLQRDSLGRFTALDFSQVMPDCVAGIRRSDLRQGLKSFQKKGRLLVQWFPTGSLTVAQLSAYLDMLERVENFKPDILLLDYLDLMYTEARDQRVSLGRLTRELRGLAGVRNLALVTATQGNRVSSTARLVGANMVSEDWSKIGTADVVCTYSQTLDERDIGLARILVAKARRARDKWIALVTQSYETGQFCLDSIYMSKLVEAEVGRITGAEEETE